MNIVDGIFLNGNDKEVDGTRGIAPIFTAEKHKITFLGTGFFITMNGLMLTAKHVLFNADEELHKNLFILQNLGNNKVLKRNIFKTYFNSSDAAVLLPDNHILRETGKPLPNLFVNLTLKNPPKGEEIISYGYPKTKVNQNENLINIQVAGCFHAGAIEEYYESGFGLLNNSCYLSSMHIQGGSSGGPVVNSKGNVFGINSTGCDVIGDLEPYSFITPIVHALELQIDGNDGNKYSLQDLVRLKFISLEV